MTRRDSLNQMQADPEAADAMAIRVGAYQFMPDPTPEEFAALKADIAVRGVISAIDVDETGAILDGHTRYRAWRELQRNELPPVIVRAGLTEDEKRSFAIRQNVHRRQLTRAQMQGLIERELKARPDRSDRKIAADLGVDHKTVAATRRGAGGELPHPTMREGRDGKTYRTVKRRSPLPADDEIKAMLGSAEAVRANAERIAALSNEVKLALFNAGLSARSTTVFRGNPFGNPPLAAHEERAWEAFSKYLQSYGWSAEAVGHHLSYLVEHKDFRTPDEWLGEEGRRFRAREGRPEPSADFLAGWKRHSGDSALGQPPTESGP
jgi:hypothetical protein